jgi:hypothetical protein
MDMLNPGFKLLHAVFAASNEHSGRIQFKKVESNPAKYILSLTTITADVSTEGADRKFSVLGCFQRIPYISISSSLIHIKTK